MHSPRAYVTPMMFLAYVLNSVYRTLCMTPVVSYADYYVVAIVLLSLCMFHHE